MTTEQSIFERAAGLPAGEQVAFLDQACAGQPELRARLDALLRAHESTGFMEGPGGSDEPTLCSAAGPDWARTLPEQPGSRRVVAVLRPPSTPLKMRLSEPASAQNEGLRKSDNPAFSRPLPGSGRCEKTPLLDRNDGRVSG